MAGAHRTHVPNRGGKAGQHGQDSGEYLGACAAEHTELGCRGLFGATCHRRIGKGNPQGGQFASQAARRIGLRGAGINNDLPQAQARP